MSVFSRGTASRSRVRAALGGIAIAGVSVLVLAGCTSGGGEGDGDASASAGPVDDLALTIGTALPQTGNLAFLGPPEEAGVAYATAQINEAAADTGLDLEVVFGDSGDTDNKAYETEIPRLLGEGATAIVGAASSGTSLQFIDQVIAADAIQFSPANTSAAFTGYEDNGLYWRTAPSDVLQGEVLGNLIAADGNETMGMIVLNDSYGTGLACFTKAAFESAGGEVVAASLYNTGDTNFSAQVEDVLAANPDSIALITFEEVKTIIPELLGADFPADKMYLVDGNLANFGDEFDAGTMAGAKGTYPAVDPETTATFRDELQAFWTGAGNPELADFTYAPESYDAVTVDGNPRITQKISGGLHGDIATASITVNSIPKILRAEVSIRPATNPPALHGSGMIIVNPPFVLEAELRVLLPALARILGDEGQGRHKLEWIAGE